MMLRKTKRSVKIDPDFYLIERIAEGDQVAFKNFLEKYQSMVYHLIRRFTSNEFEANDLSQEVFLSVWKKASTFKKKSKVSTWLYRIVTNYCLNYKLKLKRFVQFLDEFKFTFHDHTIQSAEKDLLQKEQQEKIDELFNCLPDRQRMAIILLCQENKSYQEIAEIMDTTVSSIESLIFRARMNLKKKIKKSTSFF